MLEHSAMYLNVTPPYEDDSSFFPDFYTRVGSCELQEPVWAKMNALTGIKQKRKKSDNKPQTQINKCNNEKRRREQENIYIEELAELISANFADMSSLSVKPDKCAILQETVNQIRRIKQQDNSQQIADPVQQGEVSSSRPTILSNEVYGPLLLEALEGFLFVINSEGKVEHVTDNVINYIKHAKDEIIGKSIYNFMHPGDHTKFHSNLLPMTIEWGSDPPAPTRSKSIDVRLLVKASDDLDETVEEKTQRVPCYELMHISSTQLRDHLSVSEDDGSDSGPCLLCVASRISHRDKASCFFEQFTTKLDTNGKIICVDTSGVSEGVSQVLRKDFKGRLLRDLVPAQDVFKVTAHLKETLSAGTSISSVYRIQVAPDKLVPVQTKSKFFKTNPHANSEVTDFIMATHSIIGDNDSLDPGGGIGGPLMTSIVNGAGPAARNGPSNSDNAPPSSSGGIIPPVSNAGAFTSEFLENDFSTLDFPSTTWELEPSWPDAARPNSRQSTPVSTPVSTPAPRPPSNPSYSNAPTVAQSPIAHYAAQPSPVSQQQSNQNSNSFMSFGIMEDYQEQVFNVDDQKESKANVMDEAPSHAEPQRLRSLLTNPPTSNASSSNSSSHQDENRDRILKELLNQQDDEQRMGDGRNNNARVMMRGPMPEPPKNAASSSTGNDMLRKLLNDKNDEDDIETKAGMKKGSELLQQLLKKDSDDDDERKNENGPHEDVLLKTLGFPSGSPSGNKRSMDNKDDRSSKRMNNGSQNSSGSSEKSEIYQKNKMLASLLENPTPTPPSIPPIPASVISATPQEKLPRVITDPAKLIPVTMNQGNMRPGRARQQPVTFSRPIGAANPPNFIDHNIWIENNNDPVLSAILDDFIDFVPDRNILLSESGQEGQPTNSFQLSESAAINNIQKILMEVEDSVPSPNVSLPARPPAYSTNNNLGYPPPPNYHQVKYPRPMGVRAGVPQYANPQQQLHLEQQRKIQHREAEEQKRRLLQQQEQQQLVILSNNASASINPTQTFDSLLNNTVAPNVTLQRNNIPESQLSPGYNNQLQGSNSLSQSNQRGSNRQQQQQPYSPHSQLPSPLAQQNFQPQTTAAGNYSQQQRLSPQSQYNSQLSPRQTYTTQGNGTAGGSNWAQQQQRLTVQNPMLNAQLTGTLTGRGNFQRPPSAQQSQQQRALNSPGGVQGNTRHSPFGGDQFAPPSSPTAAAFNQNQYLQRLQRANSVPTTSSQMTGGLGSPRSYSGQAPSHYPPTHLQSIPQNPMLYGAQTQQQDSPYNCYEQQQQQQPNLGYERRGGAQSQHLQPGVAGSNPTSEFVRQELRAVVGARTAQQQPAGGQRSGPTPAQQLQQQLNQSGTVDLESLGLSFEMASGASESPKLWGAMGSELGSMSPQPATSRTTMEEGRPGDHAKTSLLQQLLSDQSK